MVELSTERHSRVHASTRSTVVRCFPKTIVPMASVAPECTLHKASAPLRAGAIGAGTLYTDDSYKQPGNLANFIIRTTTSTSAAVIVSHAPDQVYEALRMDFTFPHPSA